MRNEKLIYLTAFLLSLSLILLLEAGTLRLLAEDIKPVEKKEIAVELLLSASNNPAAENTQTGNNEEFMESKNEQEENDSKEKEAKNEEADKSSSAEKEKMELEKNDQFVKEEEKREEKELAEAAEEESQAEKIRQENDLKTEEAEETEEKIEEPKNENQKAEDKEKTDNKKPAEQKETPSEKKIEKKQNTMPAWLNNSETKVEKENSKETEAEAESEKEKEDKFDLESYLAELENNDSAVQENKVSKNDENKNEYNLSGNESEIEEESRENKTENRTENKKDTAAEAAQNNEEKELYDLREAGSGIKKPGIENYSEPAYPSNLRKRNIEGKVIISLRIDREGRAHDLKINQSSGYDSFDQAALKAVSSWKFKAAEKDGKKVGVIINLPIRFELN